MRAKKREHTKRKVGKYMGNENNYEEFLEGQYDWTTKQGAAQESQDIQRAAELAQRAEVKMESAWMAERERVAAQTGERGAALDEIMNQYLKEDEYQQYLVDGAILRCENATLADYELPNGETVVLETPLFKSEEERTQIRLCVSENASKDDPESSMSIGGFAYATVKDAIKGRNIIFPCCNCKVAINRAEEMEKIMADPERNKHGVCMHLMQLNDKWRNLWKPGQSYLSKTNRVPTTMAEGFGKIGGDGHLSETVTAEMVTAETETVPGITMTSMLFCRHGGIIMPVTSGQGRKTIVDGVSDKLIRLLKSYETGMGPDGKYLEQGKPALQTYQGKADKNGVHTIGWGHAVDSFEHGEFTFQDGTVINLYPLGTQISLAQAEEILEADIVLIEEWMNKEFYDRGILDQVDQHFYDALFLLLYQNGTDEFDSHPNPPKQETDLSKWLTTGNFDPYDAQEIMEQFGEYTNNNSDGAKLRRMDELDIIFYGDYGRDEGDACLNRYGDIWAKKTERKRAEENQG